MTTHTASKGLSLRVIHICLIVAAAVLSSVMIFFTFHVFTSYEKLTEVSETHAKLREDALELMTASDYLTENVQRFTIEGDTEFMNRYFREAFRAKHREKALSALSAETDNRTAINALQAAMDSSVALMDREYYAMKLVIDAKSYSEYPNLLDKVEISEEDSALAPQEKMRRATEIVLGDEYYDVKTQIRDNLNTCVEALEDSVDKTDQAALDSLGRELSLIRIVILMQTIGISVLAWLTSKLGIRPILNAVERIKADSLIPETGAQEFRYLVRAYNKVYKYYKSSLAHLNFKASHDELTGVYNRAGYTSLLESIDLKTTYMILFDIDNFKEINDTYGHQIGDQVLLKLAQALQRHFRTDDYICRIGGDEFVVFMVHSEKKHHNLIAAKIDRINHDLMDTSDGLPATTISVGITHGSEVKDLTDLFERSDNAMYETKAKGKHSYTFSSDEKQENGKA